MVMALSGHLGLMGHAQDLGALTELAQLLANYLRDTATDTHIDLIEYQAWHVRGLRRDDLNRQTDAGKLTTRGDLAQWLRGLPGIRADQKLHGFQPLLCQLVRVSG